MEVKNMNDYLVYIKAVLAALAITDAAFLGRKGALASACSEDMAIDYITGLATAKTRAVIRKTNQIQ